MQDPRAEALLSTAYRQLQEQAGRLTDLTARQIFLEQVTCNREILAAWASREHVPPQEGPNPAEAEAG
jgi:hypothetical protein